MYNIISIMVNSFIIYHLLFIVYYDKLFWGDCYKFSVCFSSVFELCLTWILHKFYVCHEKFFTTSG